MHIHLPHLHDTHGLTHGHHHHHRRPLTNVGLFICLLGLLSIAFSITLRVIPNALQYDVLAMLNTTPEAINNLNIIYQYSLITSLVLSGLFVDMAGPRTVLLIGLGLAMACNYVFDHTDSVNLLLDSRIIISYTHPFILTSVLTLGTHWLPRRHFSLFVGLLWGTLLMTPVVAYPYIHDLQTRAALDRFIFLIDLIAIIIMLLVVLTERIADKTRHRHDLAGLFKPLKEYKVWLICIVSMLGWMTNTFLLHYGPFYLVSHYDFVPRSANDTIDASFTCFALGAVFMGLISDLLPKKRRFLIAGFYFLGALTFSLLVFFPHLPYTAAPKLIFLTAFFTSSTIICYTKASDYCAIGNSGITLGLMLSITAIGSSLFARITGKFINQYVHNPTQFSSVIFDHVLIIVPLLLILGGVIAATLLKPTHFHPFNPLPAAEKV